ncbi:MAG: hypothetical protein OXF22_04630 [Anaerolineaceae bacterium]|nr:hypothetical protein [Anaerolineaceae bacterium]
MFAKHIIILFLLTLLYVGIGTAQQCEPQEIPIVNITYGEPLPPPGAFAFGYAETVEISPRGNTEISGVADLPAAGEYTFLFHSRDNKFNSLFEFGIEAANCTQPHVSYNSFLGSIGFVYTQCPARVYFNVHASENASHIFFTILGYPDNPSKPTLIPVHIVDGERQFDIAAYNFGLLALEETDSWQADYKGAVITTHHLPGIYNAYYIPYDPYGGETMFMTTEFETNVKPRDRHCATVFPGRGVDPGVTFRLRCEVEIGLVFYTSAPFVFWASVLIDDMGQYSCETRGGV